MDKFFDFKEFIILILKKLKFIVAVTLIVTVLFGLYRTFPMIKQYVTYQPGPSNPSQEENTTSVLPYTYVAKKNYVIDNLTHQDDSNESHLKYVSGVLSSLQSRIKSCRNSIKRILNKSKRSKRMPGCSWWNSTISMPPY